MERKVILNGQEALELKKKVINKVADIVGSTLGPSGRNVMIDRNYRWPESTNDGVTVANQIVFDDELENMVAKHVIQASVKVNEDPGDGTTTAMVLARAIYMAGAQEMSTGGDVLSKAANKGDDGKNPMDIYREIKAATEKIVVALKKSAKPIKTIEDMYHVAFCSVEDRELGKQLAELVFNLGPDSFIDVAEDMVEKTEIQQINGMRLPGTYASSFFVNNGKRECIANDYPILITDHSLSNPLELKEIVEKVARDNKLGLVIMAERFETAVLNSIVATNQRAIQEEQKDGNRRFRIYALKVPAINVDQYEDIALFTGGKFISKDAKMKINNVQLEDLGQAKKVIASEGAIVITGGNNLASAIESRIKLLKEQLENEKIDLMKRKLQARIASLSASMGVIKVGAKTDMERLYFKRKIDDAVAACKAALQEGVVKGGGLALKEISEKMPKNILSEAICAPYEKIQENCGKEFLVDETIIDPVKVTRTALEVAASTASILLTTDVLIALKQEKLEDLRNILNGSVG